MPTIVLQAYALSKPRRVKFPTQERDMQNTTQNASRCCVTFLSFSVFSICTLSSEWSSCVQIGSFKISFGISLSSLPILFVSLWRLTPLSSWFLEDKGNSILHCWAEKWERKRNENQFESWMLNDTRQHDPTAAEPREKLTCLYSVIFCLFNRKCKFKIHTDFSSSSLCYVVVQPPLFLLIHPISCWFTRLVDQMEEKASHKIRNALLFHWNSKHLKFDAVLKLLKLHEKSETLSLFSLWSESLFNVISCSNFHQRD